MGPWHSLYREDRNLGKVVLVAECSPDERGANGTLVLARVKYGMGDNGLPTKPEHDRTTQVEENLVQVLAVHDCHCVGHIYFNGVMTIAFVGSKNPPATVQIKTGFLKKENINLEMRSDPDWLWYEAELAPTPLELSAARNKPLFETLAKHGDQADQVRDVDFCFGFEDPECRSQVVAMLATKGYQLSSMATWEHTDEFGKVSYLCEVVTATNLLPDAMNQRCVDLAHMAQAHGGLFDGWAAPIVKQRA